MLPALKTITAEFVASSFPFLYVLHTYFPSRSLAPAACAVPAAGAARSSPETTKQRRRSRIRHSPSGSRTDHVPHRSHTRMLSVTCNMHERYFVLNSHRL